MAANSRWKYVLYRRLTKNKPPDPTYARGCAALEKADWELVKKLFAECLEKNQTPEALEKYAWTVWWLGEEQEVSSSREQAYNLYQKKNGFRGAAGVAMWIAALRFGRPISTGGRTAEENGLCGCRST